MILIHANPDPWGHLRGRLAGAAGVQDRSRWDRDPIAQGVRLIEAALPTGPVGPYQLRAAIAAVHAEAPRAADTDWAQIETLYRMLRTLAPGPMVALNHAAAVAMVDGPAAGLAMLEPLLKDRRLRRHHRLHAVHTHLVELDGREAEAGAAYATAARLAQHPRAALPQRQGGTRRALG